MSVGKWIHTREKFYSDGTPTFVSFPELVFYLSVRGREVYGVMSVNSLRVHYSLNLETGIQSIFSQKRRERLFNLSLKLLRYVSFVREKRREEIGTFIGDGLELITIYTGKRFKEPSIKYYEGLRLHSPSPTNTQTTSSETGLNYTKWS